MFYTNVSSTDIKHHDINHVKLNLNEEKLCAPKQNIHFMALLKVIVNGSEGNVQHFFDKPYKKTFFSLVTSLSSDILDHIKDAVIPCVKYILFLQP